MLSTSGPQGASHDRSYDARRRKEDPMCMLISPKQIGYLEAGLNGGLELGSVLQAASALQKELQNLTSLVCITRYTWLRRRAAFVLCAG